MFIVDWRSKDEYCMLGYNQTEASAPQTKNGGFDWNSTYESLREPGTEEKPGTREEIRTEKRPEKKDKKIPKTNNFLVELPEDFEEEFWNTAS